MAALTSESFCLIVCFLVCSSEAQEIKKAGLGQDVILPCKVPNININIAVVQWSRPEQDPEYVLLYRDGRLDPDNQHPSYQNRVDLQDKEMKDGNFSLILKNVTKNDTGTYECWVFQGGANRRKRSGPKPISIIRLEVQGEKDGNIGDGGNKIGGDMVGISRRHHGVVGGIPPLLAVLVSLGFLMYKRPMKKNPKCPVLTEEPTDPVTVPEHHQNQVQLV